MNGDLSVLKNVYFQYVIDVKTKLIFNFKQKTIMKTYLILLLTVVIIGNTTFAQSLTVTGEIINPKADSVSFYTFTAGTRNDLVKVPLKDGKFKASVEIDSAMVVYFNDGNEVAELLLQPKKDLHISLNTELFDETMVFSGPGGMVNNMINKFYLIQEQLNNELFSLIDEGEASKESVLKMVNENHEKLTSVIGDALKIYPDLKLKYPRFESSNERNLKQMEALAIQQLEFNKVVKKLKNTEAINIKGVDLDGAPTSLDKYKGKLIVLDFWATWCGPCKGEMPSLNALEEKYGDEVAFVSVGMSCKFDEWSEMSKGFNLKRNIYIPEDDMAQIDPYNVMFIPRYMLIDQSFNIINAGAPRPSSDELEALILELK